MRLIVQIGQGWTPDVVLENFQAYCRSFTYGGGMNLIQTGQSSFQGQVGSRKKATFLGGIAQEYHGDFHFDFNANPMMLIIDYDEGSTLKVGLMGKRNREIYWRNFYDGLARVFNPPYSGVNSTNQAPLYQNQSQYSSPVNPNPSPQPLHSQSTGNKFCTKCGAKRTNPNHNFCQNCGSKLDP